MFHILVLIFFSYSVFRLLGYLVLVHPQPMVDHMSHLKEMLDYFAFMHEKISYQLVTVLLPLIKFNNDLKVLNSQAHMALTYFQLLLAFGYLQEYTQ